MMNTSGEIIYIDDDDQDRLLFFDTYQAIRKDLALENKLILFSNGYDAFNYLKNSEKPYLIISDINMPLFSGCELKESIDNELSHLKDVPFIYMSSVADYYTLYNDCPELRVDNFIDKMDYNKLYERLAAIIKQHNITTIPV